MVRGDSMNKYMISDNDLWKKIDEDFGPKPGIYKLHIIDALGNFECLSRILDNDKDGIIYIGTSAKLNNRIGALRKSICASYWQSNPERYSNIYYRDPTCHQVGKKLIKLPKFFERFPIERLCLTLELYVTDKSHENVVDYGYYQLEGDLLNKYQEFFGERPFLNN